MEDPKQEILIPPEKLQVLFNETRKQIEILLSSSKLLSGNYKYSISIALSILAREEITKLQIIENHIDQAKGFTAGEWDSLKRGAGVHLRKLQGPLGDAMKKIEYLGRESYDNGRERLRALGFNISGINYDDAMKVAESAMENLARLNLIKQDCLYLDWKNQGPHIITKKTKEQLEAFSYLSNVSNEFILFSHITNNANSKILKGDQSEQTKQEYLLYYAKTNEKRDELTSIDFQKKKEIAHTIFDDYQ